MLEYDGAFSACQESHEQDTKRTDFSSRIPTPNITVSMSTGDEIAPCFRTFSDARRISGIDAGRNDEKIHRVSTGDTT